MLQSTKIKLYIIIVMVNLIMYLPQNIINQICWIQPLLKMILILKQ